MTEAEILSKLENLEAKKGSLRKQLDEVRSRKLIKCNKCGKRTVVSKLTYLQTYWYREPYSCTGGDYWVAGEGQFECPKCGIINRLYKRPDVVDLKNYFKSVEDAPKEKYEPFAKQRPFVN